MIICFWGGKGKQEKRKRMKPIATVSRSVLSCWKGFICGSQAEWLQAPRFTHSLINVMERLFRLLVSNFLCAEQKIFKSNYFDADLNVSI